MSAFPDGGLSELFEAVVALATRNGAGGIIIEIRMGELLRWIGATRGLLLLVRRPGNAPFPANDAELTGEGFLENDGRVGGDDA